jgi:glutamine amidotransferase
VGAFAVGMDGLQKKNLIEPLREFAKSGKPMLGICLGAQLMLSKGFEFGEYEGLGIIPGVVKMFPELVAQKEKIPHVGWNGIYPLRTKEWSNTILASIEEKVSVYFTHSYIMIPDDPENVLAVAEYGGLEFCAVTRKGNVYGTQFHPEKSGKTGLNIIKNFIGLIK